jgi:hypothetical protein
MAPSELMHTIEVHENINPLNNVLKIIATDSNRVAHEHLVRMAKHK